MKKKGFTLIELLIVVAIIAILAAIAVPNFLEAQVRSKISRARADMRSMATGLESYAVDNNKYPVEKTVSELGGDPGWYRFPHMLTTPIAYLSSAFVDPFRVTADSNDQYTPTDLPKGERTFMYIRILSTDTVDSRFTGADGGSDLPSSDATPRLEWFGRWAISSFGPDQIAGTPDVNGAFYGYTYDPTNGTISPGDILRRQKTYAKDS